MTPRECLLKAHHCERLAGDSADTVNRLMLLETAEHWRNLARTAKRRPAAPHTADIE